MSKLPSPFTNRQETALTWLILILIVATLTALIATWLVLIVNSLDAVRTELLPQHFIAIVALPAAGAASFILIFIFRQTSGPVEIEGFSIKFKGAAGPLILWIMCFLAMAGAIKMVW